MSSRKLSALRACGADDGTANRTQARMSSRKLSALRACGADDGTANRTPSAWMISLVVFLAQRQIVFFVWVTFGERKWSILAERRGGRTRRRDLPGLPPEEPSCGRLAIPL